MRKKGFTLIELLAVIVILAIIALIATPIIINIISDARKESEKRSIELYASAIKNAIASYQLNNNGSISGVFTTEDGKTLTNGQSKLTVEYNGNIKCTTTEIYEDGTVYIAGCTVNGNEVDYTYGTKIIESIPLKGLTPVKYNGTSWVVTTQDDKDWYNYDKQEWANAVILATEKNVGDTLTVPTSSSTTSDVKAMFVWIPRYEYKIDGQYGKGGTSATSPGEIEIKFVPKGQTTASSGYRVHPAFTFGTEQLDGIWVGKFETSYTTLSSSDRENNLICTNENCTNADGLRILPNVVSLRNNKVSYMFFAVRSMTRSGNGFGLNLNDVNSHMMKNSEWGAVAYLSQSKYGKYGNSNYTGANKEIYQNKSSSYITGNSNGTPSQETTNTQCTYDNTTNNCGIGASTTGNITGIYDMSGGAEEYVMGVFANSSGDLWSGYDTSWNSGFTGKLGSKGTDYRGRPFPESKYYDVYKATTGTTISSTTACNGGICYGHALSETSGWYGDFDYFVNSSFPWFWRGGSYDYNFRAGVFTFDKSNGASGDLYYGQSSYNESFRVVLS